LYIREGYASVMKELVISRDDLEPRVALLEGGRLAELYVERPRHLSLVGNIYKGRVENCSRGGRRFVDIGLDRIWVSST
jgi:ribonuclease G